jgi:hypothetical protein
MPGVAGVFEVDVSINGNPYPLGNGQLISLRLHETALSLAPMAEITLEDRLNFLVELIPFTGTESIRIRLGRDEEDMFDHEFFVFDGSAAKSSTDSHRVTLSLISKSCLGMYYPSRYKGYPSSTISGVVSDIVSALGLETDPFGFETTRGSYSLFFPGWTYGQFLGWLAARARSAAHSTAGFYVFVDLEGKLHFCSPEFIKVQDPVATITPMDLTNEDKYEDTDLNQGPYTTYTTQLMLGTQGAYGVNLAYSNFLSTGSRFVESPMTVDGRQSSQAARPSSGFTSHTRESVGSTVMKGLASNVSIQKAQLYPDSFVVDGGLITDSDNLELAEANQESMLLRAVNSLVSIQGMIEGDLLLRAGRSVEINAQSVYPKRIQNQTYAGKYVLERVTHQILPSFWTQFVGFRSGVGGSDDVNLTTPPGGLASSRR